MKNQNLFAMNWVRNAALCILMGMLMVLLCPHSVNAAEALTENDFTWKMNGKKIVFKFSFGNDDEDDDSDAKPVYLHNPGDMEVYYDWRTQPIYKNNLNVEWDEDAEKYKRIKGDIVTARGIKVGSTYKQVTKKYGNKKLIKSKANDVVKKDIANRWLLVDTSKWKYYTDYTYQKYVIRFYYTKGKKVTALAVINNIKKLNSQKKDPVQITFKAPSGKKVRTKTICGTKVYVLPKGSKISFSTVPKDNWTYGVAIISKNLKKYLGTCFVTQNPFKKNVGYDAGSFCPYVMKLDQKFVPQVSYCRDKDGKKIYYYAGDKKPTPPEDDMTYQKAPKGSIWRLAIYPINEQSKKHSIKQVYYTFE